MPKFGTLAYGLGTESSAVAPWPTSGWGELHRPPGKVRSGIHEDEENQENAA